MYKKSLAALLAAAVIVLNVFTTSAATSTKQECSSGIGQPVGVSGYYIHDPMENPKAAADIVVNPNAVYGYSPNPDSTRLGVYAQYDWSDEVVVAEMRQQREDYHDSIKELYQIKADMEVEGKSVEEIARAVCIRRNELRMEAYKDDPEGLEKLKESNLATYGDENGGSPDYFYEKYGSWEMVIEKAFSTNAGADACLGLYDKYYDTYFLNTETATDATQPSSQAEQTTSPTEPGTGESETTVTSPSETNPTEPSSSETNPTVTVKDISECSVSGIKDKTYNGKAQTQNITVKDGTKTLKMGTNYKVSYANNTQAGKASVIVTGMGNYEGSITKTFKINKAQNLITVKVTTITVKLTAVKKKAQSVKAITVSRAEGKVTYKLTGVPKALGNLVKINSKGVITISKWAKAKKGNYRIIVKITAQGNSNYKSKSLTKTVTAKVK